MSGLKQQFLSIRNSTPKHVQWLLLGAAFIVVLILLTLLMTGNNGKAKKTIKEEVPVDITLSTDNIDWADVTVGTKKTETINVLAVSPTKVSMSQNKEINGFKSKTTCGAAVINSKISCNIFLEYEPTVAMSPETLTLSVFYHGENEPESMKQSKRVSIVLGATAPAPVVTPKPTPKPAPKPVVAEPVDDDFDIDDEPEYTAPAPQKIEQEIKTIAPSDPFAN